ncbi:MAG: alpha/beta hydrolase-fold protein [Polyangiales bacterium]
MTKASQRTSTRNGGRGPAVAVLVLALVALSFGVGPRGAAQLTSEVVHQYNLRVDGPGGTPIRALVTFPRQPGHAMHPEGTRWPIVVALHGLAEAQAGPDRGYLGWNVDYRLPAAFEALLRGRLSTRDFEGLVRPARLDRLNAELGSTPFRGVAVITPYVPPLLTPDRENERKQYIDWLATGLLEAVREAYPGLARTAAGTGVDGVSMGGRVALEAGFRHPEAFGAVGGIQPAVRGDVELLSGLVDRARGQRIRLLSSDDDPFLVPTRQLSDALRAKGVAHDLVVSPGPHDYAFNRGPGGIELLRFAEQALAREPFEE